MKTLLRQSVFLLSLTTYVSVQIILPASADSTADLLFSLKCPNEYTVNIWQRYQSGELLYRGTGLLGRLNLGNGRRENTGSAQVYKFINGEYEYQVLGGTGDHQGQGTLEVLKNDRSILRQVCTAGN